MLRKNVSTSRLWIHSGSCMFILGFEHNFTWPGQVHSANIIVFLLCKYSFGEDIWTPDIQEREPDVWTRVLNSTDSNDEEQWIMEASENLKSN